MEEETNYLFHFIIAEILCLEVRNNFLPEVQEPAPCFLFQYTDQDGQGLLHQLPEVHNGTMRE